MTLPAGSRFGVYEILAPLGAGGMGEVYRARDSRLQRDVAVKVLPAVFVADPERRRRFEREAQILAALNHANIADIYAVEESDAGPALIMELVEGEDCAALVARGPRPLSEVRRIATQLIEALSAAHERGIIHRDLKPANIRLTVDGTVKVLDFGLAKVLDAIGVPREVEISPTMTSASTRIGTVLGTATYMAPEQAKGIPADKRADIWAFGCVLFELLTGRAAFPGNTLSETIAAVLEREPEWHRLPPATPPGVRRVLRRCLEKDPKRRLQDIADARPDIEADVEPDEAGPGAVRPVAIGRRLVRWAAVVTLALLAAAAGWALRRVPPSAEVRLEINTAATPDATFALSPDGRSIVFTATSGGPAQLWLRALNSSTARPLPGTERATLPFWSADSRSIGFFADSQLKRVEVDTGVTRTVSRSVAVPIGGTWNRDGTILFSGNPGGPVLRVPAEGGTETPITAVDRPRQRGHYMPHFLPDGRHFLFLVVGSAETAGVYLGQLDDTRSRRLLDVPAPAVYATSGHLLVGRAGQVTAYPFDPERLELSGDPIALADKLAGQIQVSVSAAGLIAFRTATVDSGQRQLVWVNRQGHETQKVVYPDTAALGPALSRDGRRVAVYRYANANMDIWSYDTSRRTWHRLTFEPGDDIYPLWSPTGSHIIYGAVRTTPGVSLYRRAVDSDTEEPLTNTPEAGFPTDWSSDGRFLLYSSFDPKRGTDIWSLTLDGARTPAGVVQTEFNESQGQFSPDVKWIAYQSDKSGREEVYVRAFLGSGPEVLVSTDGGSQVRWNPAGKELFYIAADDRLMSVSVRVTEDGRGIEPGKPIPLFLTNVGSTVRLNYRQQYVVSPDGQSFIMNSVVGQPTASPISLILNWKPPQ